MPEKPLDCCFTLYQTNNPKCKKCEYRKECIKELDLEFKKAVIKQQRVVKSEKGKFVIDPSDPDKINAFAELVIKLREALSKREVSIDVDSEMFLGILHEYLDNHEMF